MYNIPNNQNPFVGQVNTMYGPMGYYQTPGMQPQGGIGYPQMKMPQFTNPLGKEKIDEMLRLGKGMPKILITEDDFNQAICTHRMPGSGDSAVYPIGNNKFKCKICGAEFEIIEGATDDDIRKCAENMHNLLHTAKCMWLDVPDQVARENFQILAVIDKVPQIFSIASETMERYNPASTVQQNGAYVGGNAFNTIGQMLAMPSPFMMQQPQYAQPGYGMAAPYGQPQPMGYSAQQPYGYNVGFDPNNAPMNMQQAQMMQGAPGLNNNGFGYVNVQPQQPVQQPVPQPQAQAAPAQPQQPAQTEGGARVTQQLSI